MSEAQKNKAAVELGRLGGLVKSAAKRQARLNWWREQSKAKRQEIRRKIAASRKLTWARQKMLKDSSGHSSG